MATNVSLVGCVSAIGAMHAVASVLTVQIVTIQHEEQR